MSKCKMQIDDIGFCEIKPQDFRILYERHIISKVNYVYILWCKQYGMKAEVTTEIKHTMGLFEIPLSRPIIKTTIIIEESTRRSVIYHRLNVNNERKHRY